MSDSETFENYYWRLLRQIVIQIISFGKDQIVGLILAVLILLYQLKEGLVKRTELHANELATLAYPYLTLLALYVGYEIVRAPFVLDREQGERISDLADELVQRATEAEKTQTSLSAQIGLPDPILEGEIMPGTSWGPCRAGTTFRPHISVRNVGSARTILRDWTLVVPADNLYIGVNLPESDYTGNMQLLRDEITASQKSYRSRRCSRI
jgi:hypothetical protein